ncbi:MAG: hypothetical protein KMY53_16440 [Desulfarculus sp.]|nr:hypothetical protein [Pseudomonadota bacterium]MBU4599192.1 hypothetical protein [Pseudomonadota bacterium]MBV1717651.1 hypothetical protein [Desulfarculus sp.]MBV1739755.1 hypothetical protein [Desulfarculus sp.]
MPQNKVRGNDSNTDHALVEPRPLWWPTPLKILLVMLIFMAIRQMRPLETYYPVIWPDGWGYLLPALRWMNDGALETIYSRTFGYPLFLTVVLQVTKSFLMLGIVQKALNVLGGLLILSVMADIIRVNSSGKIKLVSSWLFVLGFIWLYLGSPTIVWYEHFIQPEAIAPFIMALFIYFSWLAARKLIRGESFILPVFLLALISVAAYFHKPNWGFAVMSPIILFLLLKAAYNAKLINPVAVYLLLLALLFAPLLLWQKYLSRHDPAAVTFTPTTLFTWHLGGIKGLLEDDLKAEHPPFDRALIKSVNDMIERQSEMDRSRKIWYPSLGYNPDELYYSPSGYAAVARLNKLTPQGQKAFFMHYYYRYVLTSPGTYLNKILGQLAIYYRWNPRLYRVDGYNEFGDVKAVLQAAGGNISRNEDALPFLREYLKALRQKIDGQAIFTLQVSPLKKAVYGALRIIYYPLMLAVLGVYCLLAYFKRKKGVDISSAGLLLTVMSLTCFGAAFLADLTVAAVHSLDVGRYFDYHYTLTLASQWLALSALVWSLTDWVRLRKIRGPINPATNQVSVN